MHSPSGSSGYRLEVDAAIANIVLENIRPVVAHVPSNFARRVYFYGHDLTDLATLDDDYGCANTTTPAAAILAASDIFTNEGITISHI